MSALNEQWQAARQQRQNQVVERRDQVNASLGCWQAERLAHTVRLRQDLGQVVADLQAETSLWLTQISQQRHSQILPQRQALQQYTQQLQADTEVLLNTFQAQREVDAAILRQRLQADYQALSETTSELRLAIAQDLQYIRHQVSAIQHQTAADRAGYRQGQARLRAELWPPLLRYVEELQAQVQMALTTMGEARQQLALVQQEQRQSDRQALATSVEAMFVQLAAFRQDLHTQRAQITTLVWGTEPVPTPGVSPQAARKPSTISQKPAAAPKPIAAKPGIAPKVAVAQPKGAPQPAVAVKPLTVAKPAVAAKPAAVAKPVTPVTPLVPASSFAAPVVVEPLMAEVKSAQTPTPSLEEVVYNYLHLAQGARLSEIETELGINRFQAVDALRSLIQKDLIIKQDRTYLIQEEAVL